MLRGVPFLCMWCPLYGGTRVLCLVADYHHMGFLNKSHFLSEILQLEAFSQIRLPPVKDKRPCLRMALL